MKKMVTTVALWGTITVGAMANTPQPVSHKEKVEMILAAERETWTAEELQELESELKALKESGWENMTKQERKELKKSLREVKREVKSSKALGGGVYLSATAIIIILLVLIIIL